VQTVTLKKAEKFMNEISIMMEIEHPYLLRFLGVCRNEISEDKYFLFIFMEEYNGGTLFDLQVMRKHEVFTEREI